MVQYTNRAVYLLARNGTTTHTIDPTSSTNLTEGSAFTPTLNRVLTIDLDGSVTSTTPSGWTLNTGMSAINNTGLYGFIKTAASGSNSTTTTHNASNYPIKVIITEWPAGTTFVKAVSATNTTRTGAGPNLGTIGTHTVLKALKALANDSATATVTTTWSGTPTPIGLSDSGAAFSTTDGYWLAEASVDDTATTSWTPTGSMTASAGISATASESINYVLNVPSGGSQFPVSGSAAVVSAASATPLALLQVGGSAPIVAGASAAPASIQNATGSAAVVSAGVGSVSSTQNLVGVASVVSAASAAVTLLGQASGSAAVVTTAAVTVVRTTPVLGSAAITSTATGTVGLIPAGGFAVQGSATVVTTASAQLTLRAAASSTAAVTSTATGAVSQLAAISGSAPIASGASAAVTVIPGAGFAVQGTASVISAASASIALRAGVAGSATVTSGAALSAASRQAVQMIAVIVTAAYGSVTNSTNSHDITVTATLQSRWGAGLGAPIVQATTRRRWEAHL